jgi:hypothetical protein
MDGTECVSSKMAPIVSTRLTTYITYVFVFVGPKRSALF